MRARGLAGVLFDKDGTLFDFEATWRDMARRLLGALAPGNAARQADLGAALGFDPATGRFRAGSALVGGSVSDIAAILSEMVPGTDAASLERMGNALAQSIGGPALVTAVADLGGLLDGLAASGLVLGVATNDGEQAARLHLERAGVLDRFAFVAGYDSGHGMKPDPGMVLAFAAACGLSPADVAMVGDSVHDLYAARAAGVRLAVGVLTGPAGEADLAPLADAVLPSIGALPAFLAAEGL